MVTPYSLRRGGATALFRQSGSFDVVANKGRWVSLAALRLYVTTALAELADAKDDVKAKALLVRYAQKLNSVS